jgi:ethanolamine utilization microcompartment shell protein EutL
MVVVVAVLTVVPVVHLRVVAALLKVPFASTLSADMMTSSAALETVTVVPPVSMTSAPTAVVTAAVLLTTAAVEDGTSMLISVVRDGPVLGVDRDS